MQDWHAKFREVDWRLPHPAGEDRNGFRFAHGRFEVTGWRPPHPAGARIATLACRTPGRTFVPSWRPPHPAGEDRNRFTDVDGTVLNTWRPPHPAGEDRNSFEGLQDDEDKKLAPATPAGEDRNSRSVTVWDAEVNSWRPPHPAGEDRNITGRDGYGFLPELAPAPPGGRGSQLRNQEVDPVRVVQRARPTPRARIVQPPPAGARPTRRARIATGWPWKACPPPSGTGARPTRRARIATHRRCRGAPATTRLAPAPPGGRGSQHPDPGAGVRGAAGWRPPHPAGEDRNLSKHKELLLGTALLAPAPPGGRGSQHYLNPAPGVDVAWLRPPHPAGDDRNPIVAVQWRNAGLLAPAPPGGRGSQLLQLQQAGDHPGWRPPHPAGDDRNQYQAKDDKHLFGETGARPTRRARIATSEPGSGSRPCRTATTPPLRRPTSPPLAGRRPRWPRIATSTQSPGLPSSSRVAAILPGWPRIATGPTSAGRARNPTGGRRWGGRGSQLRQIIGISTRYKLAAVVRGGRGSQQRQPEARGCDLGQVAVAVRGGEDRTVRICPFAVQDLTLAAVLRDGRGSQLRGDRPSFRGVSGGHPRDGRGS